MITLVIGGKVGHHAVESLQPITTLSAGEPRFFKRFCDFALTSTQPLTFMDHRGNVTGGKVADDDCAVHFSDEYLVENGAKEIILLKLSTVIEVGMEMGLSVEVVVLGEEVEKTLSEDWPNHWPERQLFR